MSFCQKIMLTCQITMSTCQIINWLLDGSYWHYSFERTMTFISIILKPCDLKFGMHVVKILFYAMKLADYTYDTNFLIFRSLKRVGSVLSRSELDPFLYIWYYTVTKSLCLGLDLFSSALGKTPPSHWLSKKSYISFLKLAETWDLACM